MAITKKNDVLAGIILAFIAALLWSGNYIVARGLYQKISPVSLAFMRWLTAVLFLFPIAYKSLARQWRLALPHLKYLSITALMGVTLFNTFIYIAGHYTSAMNLAIIGTTAAPVFVLLLSFFFLKEKLTLLQMWGTAFCVAGILLLISKGNISQLRHFALSAGDAWVLLAALFFAVYTLLVRRKPKELSALTFLFFLFLLGTLFLFPAFIADVAFFSSFTFSADLVLVFIYLGVGASAGAFLAWNVAIQKIGPSRTSLFANLIPVFSTIEAVFILGEKNTPVIILSLAIILTGLILANLRVLKEAVSKKNT